MAQAYKCDRCGKFYEENIITHENERKYLLTKNVNRGDHIAEHDFDLCGACQSALECFMLRKTFSPGEVYATIVVHGQNDFRFKPHEQIKYSPSEIEDILKGSVNNVGE